MAGKGKKTFVAGEVLLAQDVNDYLMDQSVMNFATEAARSSAIPTPTEGMTSYISTTGTASIPQIETYTGSAWQTPYGLTLISNTSFSAQASVSFSNVFSSTYSFYRIVGNMVGSTGGSTLNARYRENTTDKTTGYFGASGIAAFGGQFQIGSAFNNAAEFNLRFVGIGGPNLVNFDIYRTATSGQMSGNMADYPNGQAVFMAVSNVAMSNFTGFSIYPASGTITGNVKIYGYRAA
jgi:hypothetical protein